MKPLSPLFVALVLLLAAPAGAQHTKFLGDWLNANPSTSGIVSLHITSAAEGIVVGQGEMPSVELHGPTHVSHVLRAT